MLKGLSVLCPGTFDPVTNGHLDILRRAAARFEHVIVAVLENPSKTPLFDVPERVAMLEEAMGSLPGVEVASFSGLLVDFAREKDARGIVRGIRAVTDFDYEMQMAQMNYQLGGVETFFMATSPQWSYLSSSLIKEVAGYGGDVSGLVPAAVSERLRRQMAAGRR